MKFRFILTAVLVGVGAVFVVYTTAQVDPNQSISNEFLSTSPSAIDTDRNDIQAGDLQLVSRIDTPIDTAGGLTNTGADACGDVSVINVPVGPEGSPTTVTVFGDNTPAGGFDCNGLGLSPIWWEAFFIDQPAYVYIDLCNTTPVQEPSYQIVMSTCTNRASCGSNIFIQPMVSGTGAPVCADGNSWMEFRLISAGTYYIPIYSDEAQLTNGRGPYELHIAAEELTDFFPGPDIITGHVGRVGGTDLIQLGRQGAIGSGTVGLGMATTSCNQGDVLARWFQLPDTNHPVMAGNMYRLRNIDGSDRLEQIGQSWIKHGWGSSNDNECGFGCVCLPEQGCGFPTVGPGCSDTYAGIQFDPCGLDSNTMGLMASRSVIHPYTGFMQGGGNMGPGGGCNINFPSANHIGHNHDYSGGGGIAAGISHRLQIRDKNLMPDLNPDTRYFGEGLYIVPDEYTVSNGTQNNNVTYREFQVIGPDGNGVFVFNPLEASHDQSPAIDAWLGASQSKIEPAPMGDGRAFLVYEVTDLGGGQWHYEYGLYNMNMDSAMRSITFPVPTGVTISNVSFHAPLNHAPETNAENYPNTPWNFESGDGFIRWSVATYPQDPLANAVRWGTMFNFRYDADTPPQSQYAVVGLYKTGGVVNTPTLVPQAIGPADCNGNGIDDACDLDCNAAGCNVPGCGGSVDCDGTGVPDECEIDCNGNGIADSCDIANLTSPDCSENGIPDECESDCNENGTADICEILDQSVADVDANGIPDVCDVDMPMAEPSPVNKSRYLTIVSGNPGRSVGIRVTLTQLDGFGSFDSQVRWVGPPAEYQEGATPTPTMVAAGLQCTPHYQDWSAIEILHLFGAAIVPGSIYDIQIISDGLDIGFEGAYSFPLTVNTGKWGDIITPFDGEGSAQPSISDILSLVDKWLGTVDPIKARAQLRPNVPDPIQNVGIAEVLLGVDAWLGVLYPFDGPGVCP